MFKAGFGNSMKKHPQAHIPITENFYNIKQKTNFNKKNFRCINFTVSKIIVIYICDDSHKIIEKLRDVTTQRQGQIDA